MVEVELTLPLVIAGWGLANGVLTVILVAFNENVFATALHGASALLVEVIALAAWWSASRRPGRAVFTPAPQAGYAAFIAASATPFLALGYVYRPWMYLGAAYPLVNLAMQVMRKLLPPRPEPRIVPVDRAEPEPSAVAAAVAGAGAATAAAGILRAVRRRRGR